jgi:predicted RNase H-like nuclease (RuvC/YqgF family)
MISLLDDYRGYDKNGAVQHLENPLLLLVKPAGFGYVWYAPPSGLTNRRSEVFKWLERIVFGVPVDEWCPQLPGRDDSLEQYRESRARIEAMLNNCPERVRERKKEQLEEELEDAKWILEYERKLTAFQEEIAEEIDRAQEVDRRPERLQKLNRRLTHLRAGMRVK